MSEKKTLTEAECKKLGEDYNRLLNLGMAQFEEYKMWLRAQILNLDAVPGPQREHLATLVDEVKFGLVTVEAGIKDQDEKTTISIVYEYPDALHAFLSSTNVPAHLNLAKQGGITLEENPPVVKA